MAFFMVLFLVDHQADEFGNTVIFFDRMPQGFFENKPVGIAASFFDPLQVTALFQFANNSLNSPLRDPDHHSNVAKHHFGVARQADQHVGMVGEKGPACFLGWLSLRLNRFFLRH